MHSCSRHLIQTISMARPCKLNFVYCSLMNLYTRCNWSTSLVLEMSLTTIYRKLSWYRQIPYYNLAGTICLCKWTIACISHILLKKSIIHSIVLHYWYSTVSRIDDNNLWLKIGYCHFRNEIKSYGSRTLYKYFNVNNKDNNLYSFCICLLGGEYSDTKDIGATPILSNTIVYTIVFRGDILNK